MIPTKTRYQLTVQLRSGTVANELASGSHANLGKTQEFFKFLSTRINKSNLKNGFPVSLHRSVFLYRYADVQKLYCTATQCYQYYT